jgi:serine/threonine-protein kinase
MLGQYELQELLGMGGMGAVYRGFQQSLKRPVAVKVLSPALAQEADYLERFNREAETAAALEHQHIVPIHDYGVQDDISYVVMRMLSGGTLASRTGEMTLPDIAKLLIQLGSALDYAHSKGVIHRDIKPTNIMFDSQNSPYIVDFGIAKLVTAGTSNTASGVMMGTPAYMAPEQWRAEMPVPATDQYALGVVAYSLITGQLPFEAPTPYGMMHKHLNEYPTPPQLLRANVPASVAQVLAQSMAKNPADRFPSVTAFAEAFEAAVLDEEHPTSPRPITPPTIPPRPVTPAPNWQPQPSAPNWQPANAWTPPPPSSGTPWPVQTPGWQQQPHTPPPYPARRAARRSLFPGMWLMAGAVIFGVIVLGIIVLILVATRDSNNEDKVPSSQRITQAAQTRAATQTVNNRPTATTARGTNASTPTQLVMSDTPSSPVGTGCEFAPTYQPVNIGNTAEVTRDGAGLRLRSSTSTTAELLRELRTGIQMIVVGGPTCADGYRWWQVQLVSDGTTGWIADGTTDELWVQWVTDTPTLPSIVTPPFTITQYPPVIISPTPMINFNTSQNTIYSGECVTIWWDVENISQVYYEGEGVTGHEARTACPTTSTTYTLRVIYLNGIEETYTVTVEVLSPTP